MLSSFDLQEKNSDTVRTVWLQNEEDERAADCIVFLDAEFYIERISAPQIISVLCNAGALGPTTVAYVSHIDTLRRAKDCTCNPDFGAFVNFELIPAIKERVGNRDRMFLCGLSLSALAAIHAAILYPSTFHGILAQSPSAWWDDERLVKSLDRPISLDCRIWMSVGNQETEEMRMHSNVGLFQRTSQRASVKRLSDKLLEHQNTLYHHEFSGGHDMACWAAELPRALNWLTNKN